MMWPGIHKRVFHLMNQQCNNGRLDHDGKQLHGQQNMNEDSPYADEMRRCNDDTTPVDVHGEAGDVVFWHHRCGHSASKNRSNVIRQAVLYDFRHKKLSLEERLQEGDVPDPTTAPPANMWLDWSDEVKATPPTKYVRRGARLNGAVMIAGAARNISSAGGACGAARAKARPGLA